MMARPERRRESIASCLFLSVYVWCCCSGSRRRRRRGRDIEGPTLAQSLPVPSRSRSFFAPCPPLYLGDGSLSVAVTHSSCNSYSIRTGAEDFSFSRAASLPLHPKRENEEKGILSLSLSLASCSSNLSHSDPTPSFLPLELHPEHPKTSAPAASSSSFTFLSLLSCLFCCCNKLHSCKLLFRCSRFCSS